MTFPDSYQRSKKKIIFLKKILSFQGVTYLFTGDIAKKKTVRICRNSFSRRNKYVHYQKLLILHHLILSKDYVAHFADQPLLFGDQIFVNCRPKNNQENFVILSLFILVCEGNTYNLLVQRNYFQKQSPITSLQKCVLQICSKFTRGDPQGNLISKKVAQHSCVAGLLFGDMLNTFFGEHLWGTGYMFYIICFGASNK